MKCLWRIVLPLLLTGCTLPPVAAENSQIFILQVDVRVGDLEIPRGQYHVSWTEPSGSQVRLTLTGGCKKLITILARPISERHPKAGITTFEENGVTYLEDFHTTDETFIIPGTPKQPNYANGGHKDD